MYKLPIDKLKSIAASTVATTIVLGTIGSGVWDIIAKPGLSRIARSALSTVTLGSARIRDGAYASAALDASPLTSLVLLFLVSCLPLFLIIWFVHTTYLEPKLRESTRVAIEELEAKADSKAELLTQLAIRMDTLRQRMRRIAASGILMSLILLALALTATGVINQAIAVRRVFFANLAICAPLITDVEEEAYRARFARMKGRADYIALRAELDRLAAAHNIKLLSGEVW